MMRVTLSLHNEYREYWAKLERERISLLGQLHSEVGAEFGFDPIHEAKREMLQRRLENIDSALQRVERGSYGMCQECRSRIPDERLKVEPTAPLCIDCQRRLERRTYRGRLWAKAA